MEEELKKEKMAENEEVKNIESERKEKMPEQIKEIARTTFRAKDMPIKLFEKLDEWSFKEFGNCRWMLLKHLYDSAQVDIKTQMLFDRDESIVEKVLGLEERINKLEGKDTKPEKVEFKGFGQEKKEENENGE